MLYLYLGIAITAEVIGTTMLKASDGFTRLTPALMTVAFYAVSFYFLSLTLRVMATGIAYAIWSGFGIVLITAIGWIWFRQELDTPAIVGLVLIIAGVLTINLFSKTIGH